MKGRFSVISHHIERLDTWLAHVAIIYLENCLQLLPPKNLFSSIPECRSARRAFMAEVAESIADTNRFCDSAFGFRAEWQHCRRCRKFQWEWKEDWILYLWRKFKSPGFTFLCGSRRSFEGWVFYHIPSHRGRGYLICPCSHHLSKNCHSVTDAWEFVCIDSRMSSARRAFMLEVTESIADSNRFCDSAFGFRAEWQYC